MLRIAVNRLLSCLMMLMALVSCEKENPCRSDKYVLFEFSYINYAWGLSYDHWIIDNEGNVRINRKADSVIRIERNNFDCIVGRFDSVIFKADKTDLDKFRSLIGNTASGPIECEDNNWADFGGYEYNCYLRDEKILIYSVSDNQICTNFSNSAIEIQNWLKTIYDSISDIRRASQASLR